MALGTLTNPGGLPVRPQLEGGGMNDTGESSINKLGANTGRQDQEIIGRERWQNREGW